MRPETEKKIFDKISKDDIKSFEILFREYYTVLCNYANKMLNDMDSAEEIIQDLFYNIWDKRHEINVTSSVKSYLYRSVYNKSLLFIRHKNVKTRYENYMKETESYYEPDVSEEYVAEELSQVINKTLEALPERSRKIFSLSRFEGLKYHEIAEKLSLSVKTIEANMGKALKLFRKNIKAYLETT